MEDTFDLIMLATPFLVSLALTGGLWWLARRFASARRFWGWLALGWTLNIFGNVIWIVHDMLAATRLPPLSWVDTFYVARYACLGWAFWRYPTVWEKRRLRGLVGLVLLAALLLWLGIYGAGQVAAQRPWVQVLGVAIYVVLDVGLLYILGRKWREGAVEPWPGTLLLLLFGALSYGVANGINLSVRLSPADEGSVWAMLFWFSADVLTAAAAIRFARLAARQGDRD